MKLHIYSKCCSYNRVSQTKSRKYVIARTCKRIHATSLYRESTKNSKRGEDFQLPGFSHVVRKRNTTKIRILWAFICFVVLLSCTYQCGERVHYFLTIKPAMNTKLVTRQRIPFPAMVVCPCDGMFRNPSVDSALLQELYDNVSYSNVYDLMDKTQMDIKTLWNISRLVTTTTNFALTHGANLATGFQETSKLVEVSEIFTTSGTCFLVRAKHEVLHQGLHTYIRLEGSGNQSAEKLINKYYRVAYTTEDNIPLLKYFYPMQALFSPMNSVNVMILRLEEVHLLNTWSQPCSDGMSIVKCLSKCIQNEIFVKVKKPCRLPYMERLLTIPDCSTSQEFRAVFNATDQVVQQFRPEQCVKCNLRYCKETIYNLESFSQHHDYSILFQVWVLIPENRFPYTQEENIYSLIALFSDIGGGLGFFLGICALQIIELFVIICDTIVKKVQFRR